MTSVANIFMLLKRKKKVVFKTEYQVWFDDRLGLYHDYPEDMEGLTLTFISHSPQIAIDFLEKELSEQYGMSWFYNELTGKYHIYGGQRNVVAYIKPVKYKAG